ncbi:OB-fold domain-containing protein [uncultured Brevundimonas sp.]|uniref:Zn-ribbon domain-containing OB-fold protein n=1 Tax=uncultured Brevundimonas sp. TaxID=213418 RepID=UPI0025E0119C|nr:OB-fold domain-containing protein [uncultured Brevundimonas sp.]
MDEVDTSGTAEWLSEARRLQLGHCRACDAVHYYPRRACPFCSSLDVGRRESLGKGTIYSHSLTTRGPNGPYVLAYVTLNEGVSILTNIVDADPSTVTIGQAVEVVFKEQDSALTPFFRPSA